MIGRADIEGSKATSLRTLGRHKPVIPVVTFSDTSRRNGALRSGKDRWATLSRSVFVLKIEIERAFCPFAPREVSVLAELAFGHLRYRLTDVPPQSNSPARHGPRLRVERGPQSAGARALALARGPPSDPSPFHRVSEETTEVAVFQVRRHRTTQVTAKAGKPGRTKRQHTEEAEAPPNREEKRKQEAKRKRRRREANPPPPAANPSPHDRIRYRQTKPTPTATDGRRPAPINALPTPTKACLPPMLHLPCLLTESD
ncbi:unnamed protein product [Acanthosepion pharaonis]|uniref:Uncharacterized protein n=1 Tax=Acanthosepion pharaonis TaxID=158019 RepID=A0A812B5I4_ACAPH|nr:unnamed protein product [Sepia pharaonis]